MKKFPNETRFKVKAMTNFQTRQWLKPRLIALNRQERIPGLQGRKHLSWIRGSMLASLDGLSGDYKRSSWVMKGR